MNSAHCRFCGTSLKYTVVDLGMQPFANRYLDATELARPETLYPLRLYVCESCFLVQIEDVVRPEDIFSDYAYFSSYSDSWLRHAKAYTDMIVARLDLNRQSQVVEIASNDGYLLQYFVEKSIPVLGLEPAANVARVAIGRGIPTIVKFFGEEMARELVEQGTRPDLLLGNNVLAHVPDLNGFIRGLKTLLKPHGVITLEFPHLLRLMAENQFDTIYHEHYSYFSFCTVERIFGAHGLVIFDVDELPTHGGSLRIYARHDTDTSKPQVQRVADLRVLEEASGLASLEKYLTFGQRVEQTKRKLVDLLTARKREGKSIAGYGAPTKGTTLLNSCGIGSDLIEYTVDRSPYKQGRFLPGNHIPIYPPEKIKETRPDYVLILPWNLKDEIMQQIAYICEWGGHFVIPIPEARVLGDLH